MNLAAIEKFTTRASLRLFTVSNMNEYFDKDRQRRFDLLICVEKNKIVAACISNISIFDAWGEQLAKLLCNIKRLDLINVEFQHAPDWMLQFHCLESLSILGSPYYLYSLACIKNISSLRKLYISYSPVFLNEIGYDYDDLIYYGSRNIILPELNLFLTLPEWIGELTQITSLYISYYGISTLPECLRKLTQLTTIDVSFNQIKRLPEWLGEFSGLSELVVRENRLKSLPDCIGKLEKLTVFDICRNEIDNLPEWIGNLTQITVLGIGENKIYECLQPPNLGKLIHLKWLDFSCSSNKILPKWFENLTQLEVLCLRSNTLESLPVWITKLNQLTILDLGSNHLTSLPKWVGSLTQLKSINIEYNKIQELPTELGGLTELESIYLAGNRIKNVPECIGNLSQLKVFDISNNCVQKLPESLENLTLLESLNIQKNWVSKFPDVLKRIGSLILLDVSDNFIRELPEGIDELTCLTTLSLSHNPIRYLPKCIGSLPRLKMLELCELHLDTLDHSLLNLNLPFLNEASDREEGILLYQTEIDKIDKWLFFQNREVIESFFAEPLIETKECKVTFLGKGDVGKTSLIKRLKEQGFSEEKTVTRGISISSWRVKEEYDYHENTYKLWDFGGQLELDIAHKCFMTSGSVYVVVFSSLEDATMDRDAIRWMDTINTFAPGSSVILVINKIDLSENSSLDIRTLCNKYKNIVIPVIRTSAKTQKGIVDLRGAIFNAAKDSTSYKMLFNYKWLAIKRELESNNSKYIEDITFEQICNKNGVQDQDAQNSILTWFGELGISFCYRDRNRFGTLQDKYYVLNPNWLTNGMYRLIVHSKEGTPFVSHSDIFDLLRNPKADDVEQNISYNEKESAFILWVARYFELSFETRNNCNNEYYEFLPMKSRKEEYDINISFTKSMHIRWSANYIPLLILYRLMVRRCEDLNQDKVWRYGAYFTNKTDPSTHAKVVADISESTIDLYVVSDKHEAKAFLDVLRNELNQLLENNMIDAKETFVIQRGTKTGEISFSDLLYYLHENKLFDIPRFAKNLDAGEILDLYFSREKVNDFYESAARAGRGFSMNIEKVEGDIISCNENSGNFIQAKNSSISKVSQKVETYPTDNWPKSVTREEFSELKDFFIRFFDSDFSDEVKAKDYRIIQAGLDETYESGWEKIREFFSSSADAITIATAIAGFISANGANIADWIKKLF